MLRIVFRLAEKPVRLCQRGQRSASRAGGIEHVRQFARGGEGHFLPYVGGRHRADVGDAGLRQAQNDRRLPELLSRKVLEFDAPAAQFDRLVHPDLGALGDDVVGRRKDVRDLQRDLLLGLRRDGNHGEHCGRREQSRSRQAPVPQP